ncbi:site-specific DNA-methyltransferase [Bacillus altitudinis]|uniref:DNA-methyltransferase n=1 Tax=Bacillus altitudinis TaxID=293387 RepID=UPI002D78B4D8|nr:site-specific DNA-methyltransferase [Bacillus altitudinis]WRO26655.1 site-specific DNA-methyltransferase [Bacillus altitudinis]
MKKMYSTNMGEAYCGDSLELLRSFEEESINLIITSPPFALLRKKDYGNKDENEYVSWLSEFGKIAYSKLKKDGSLVIDLGGAYLKGQPVRSLYNYRVLLEFCDNLGYNLAQEFFWYNPSKLPSPIAWVNKGKIRVKDSVNTVWWFSKSERPKSDIRKVLVPYSDRMKKLLENSDKYYTPKERPSGHHISNNFSNNNGGAIPSNLLKIANTESNSKYLKYFKKIGDELGIKSHPARFPKKLPEFFIKLLTEENDLVVDIFSGSNTTGEVAEELGRKWISCDLVEEYVASSVFRFSENELHAKSNFLKIISGELIEIK